MGAYTRTVFRGKTLNNRTAAMLREAERRLGYELTIVQGSYNAGRVSQSAGTHDGGGAIDLAPYDWQNKVRVLRAIGFAAWYRPAISGLWGAHVHAIAIGDSQMSAGAQKQVTAYYNGRDGLAGNRVDPHNRPNPIPVYAYYAVDLSNVLGSWGSKNPRPLPGVAMMQRALNRRGAKLKVDGLLGPATKAAFKKFSGGVLPNLKNINRLGSGGFFRSQK